MSSEKKELDDFLVGDIEELSGNEIKLNIKTLIESYLSQAAIAEKILFEFTKTRRIIELFLIEYLKRGEPIEILAEQLKELDNVNLNKNNEQIKEKTSVRFKETKHEGDRF